ncbi:MAG: SDR family NAD(P)-dependent oxidoreductase [Candidatus Hydrogenedentota bacterium]
MSGLTALVTGGNRGIGRATAERLAAEGAVVCVTGRNETTLADTAAALEKLSPGSWFRKHDVRDEPSTLALFDDIRDHRGSLDICIPNAGEATLANTTETTLADWQRDIDTNLTGTFLTARSALRMMKEKRSGWIIPIVSQAGKLPFELRAAYCASKWGALGFTKCLALEAKRHGVRVTAICPASVATDFQKDNPSGTDWMLSASDVADAVLYALTVSPKVELEEVTLRCWNKPERK